MAVLTNQTYAGARQVQIRDEIKNISFPVLILYPSDAPAAPTNIGPYTFDISPDAGVKKGKYPLVVVSHGNGGSHLLYRTIGIHLAQNGYIVAFPEHFGNNRNNNSLEGTTENLVNRPRHVILTIDYISNDPVLGEAVNPDQVALIGHSMGGYTALAVAGGLPYTQQGEAIAVPSDARVKALVLMAPAAGWFNHEAGLKNVAIPILVLLAEHDPVTPDWNGTIIQNRVPDKTRVVVRTIKNAGHFSFLSPFPENMKRPGFLPATDPGGFDREQFHKELPKEISEFLNESLKR